LTRPDFDTSPSISHHQIFAHSTHFLSQNINNTQ
jgi:hypothetical protein